VSDIITDYMLGQECRELAQDIFGEMLTGLARDETPKDHLDDMRDRARESVDGHHWVIYTHKSLLICAHCDTSDGEAFVEDTGLPTPFSLSTIATAIVFGEMLARAEMALQDLCDDWEDTRPDEEPGHAE